MPGGVCTATGFASGPSGRCGRGGGFRNLIADVGMGGVAKGTTASCWDETLAFVDGTVDGKNRTGAHFSSVRDQVKQRWLLTGFTRNSSSAAVANAVVSVFNTQNKDLVATATSDVNGFYSLTLDGNSSARYAVAYFADSPDLAGTTVNTLIPVLT